MDPAIRDPIKQFVVKKLLSGDARGLEDDTDLIASGVLRSLTMLELTSFLEKTFGIRVKPVQVVPQSFRSIRAMVKLVEDCKGP